MVMPMVKTARLALLLLTMLSCVGCDQVTKSAARAQLVPGASISLLGDVIRLEYIENPGAFLSLGHSLPVATRHALFTYGGALLVLGAMLWALFSLRATTARTVGADFAQTLGAALICGGGLGNSIDRFAHGGYVTDFLNVGIGGLRTGIFNVADFALLLGFVVVAASRTGRTLPTRV
jgi:signal peptidase II